MGLLDSIVSSMSARDPQMADQASLLPALIDQVNRYPGGLPGLIEKFQQGGLGGAVASWIGTGQNDPVTPGQLNSVLGDGIVSQLAERSGLESGAVLSSLSAMLPSLVDQLTPNGQADVANAGNSGLLSTLSGMLGKR